jgi:hypothetical protein
LDPKCGWTFLEFEKDRNALVSEMDVFLSDRAFIDMTIASIEVYHDECLGLLLGHNTRNRIVVEHAIVLQSAKRSPTGVEPSWNRETKVRAAVTKLMHLKPLGYFHSHTQWGSSKGLIGLSDLDKESMEPTEIELLVAVNDAKSRSRWHDVDEMDLAGSIGDWHLRIAAYYKRKRGRNSDIARYRILCPYALGFDYVF